jgi:thioredoxin reductase (NADPH)
MHDLIIIGIGPAGLTAAIYAARYKLDCIVIGAESGGKLSYAHQVDNYPGFAGLSGRELMSKIRSHAELLGAKIFDDQVKRIEISSEGFDVWTFADKYSCKSLLLCIGAGQKKETLIGEENFLGRGVSYCASCDGAFYKGKVIAIYGHGQHAAIAAKILSQFAKKLYLICDSKNLGLEEYENDLVPLEIEIIYDVYIKAILGNERLESITLSQSGSDDKNILVDALFIETATIPPKEFMTSLGITTDEKGFIIVDSACKTSVRGVFAAGDVTIIPLKQAVVAAGQAAVACWSAFNYIKDMKNDRIQ